MNSSLTTLTERGQVSMPANLRKKLCLMPGQPLLWEMVSDHECRVTIVRQQRHEGAKSMRGFMKRFQTDLPKTTAGWMALLRGGERK